MYNTAHQNMGEYSMQCVETYPTVMTNSICLSWKIKNNGTQMWPKDCMLRYVKENEQDGRVIEDIVIGTVQTQQEKVVRILLLSLTSSTNITGYWMVHSATHSFESERLRMNLSSKVVAHNGLFCIDILQGIFSFLEPKDLCTNSEVCKEWLLCINDYKVWKKFANEYITNQNEENSTDWKQIYKLQYMKRKNQLRVINHALDILTQVRFVRLDQYPAKDSLTHRMNLCVSVIPRNEFSAGLLLIFNHIFRVTDHGSTDVNYKEHRNHLIYTKRALSVLEFILQTHKRIDEDKLAMWIAQHQNSISRIVVLTLKKCVHSRTGYDDPNDLKNIASSYTEN